MKKKMTTVAFSDTPAQAEKLNALIASYKDKEGNLMPVLQGAQDIYGYLPLEVMKTIALGLDVSVSEVYGVASFYSQFSFNPKGKVSIAVCLGTACYVKGSGKLHEKCMEITGIGAGDISPDGRFSYDATRCIGACGLAPVLTVNEDVYGRLTVDDVDDILAKYVD
jgi:NADH:ubiquinone oxidoreductase subunit E